MGKRWLVMLTGYAFADGLYWVAVKPRLRRALGMATVQAPPC
jgi:hypothetical protein